MDMSGGSRVEAGFREALLAASTSPHPVLLRLNADASFLLSLPYPRGSTQPDNRCRYNILLDPWLQGPQSDVASWFSTQWHAIESSVKTIKELNEILKVAELSCLGLENSNHEDRNFIDAVTVSHEFTDHCHEATLRELDPTTPIFATAKAFELINSWNYFHNVYSTSPFTSGFDWRTTSVTPLPSWLGISRLVTEGNPQYYHAAIVICIKRIDSDGADAIIYTPHGVEASSFSAVSTADPSLEVLVLLHGLHDVSLKWMKQLNLGAHNALKAQKLLKARYWVAIHDEVKRGAGIITPILQRKAYTLQDALAQDQKDAIAEFVGNSAELKEVAFVDLDNGQSLVLT